MRTLIALLLVVLAGACNDNGGCPVPPAQETVYVTADGGVSGDCTDVCAAWHIAFVPPTSCETVDASAGIVACHGQSVVYCDP